MHPRPTGPTNRPVFPRGRGRIRKENLSRGRALRIVRRNAALRRIARWQDDSVTDPARLHVHLVGAMRAIRCPIEGDLGRVCAAAIPAFPVSQLVFHESPLSRRRPATGDREMQYCSREAVGGGRTTQLITPARAAGANRGIVPPFSVRSPFARPVLTNSERKIHENATRRAGGVSIHNLLPAFFRMDR